MSERDHSGRATGSGRLIGAGRSAIGGERPAAQAPARRASARVAREVHCPGCQTTQRVGRSGQCPACGVEIGAAAAGRGAAADGSSREIYCDACEAPRPVGADGRCLTCRAEVAAPGAERARRAPTAVPAPVPAMAAAPAAASASAPGERTGLWTEYCPRCESDRTHSRHGCSGCALRTANRQQGVLYAVIGAAVIAGSLIAIKLQGGGTIFSRALLFVGFVLTVRGVHAVLVGSNPER